MTGWDGRAREDERIDVARRFALGDGPRSAGQRALSLGTADSSRGSLQGVRSGGHGTWKIMSALTKDGKLSNAQQCSYLC